MRAPSLFSITFGLSPSMIATHEFVVPRSMPMIFAMFVLQKDFDVLRGVDHATFQAASLRLEALTVTSAGRRTRSAIV